MRRYTVVSLVTQLAVYVLLILFLSLNSTAYAAQYCLGGGKPQAGQGGSQGDKCHPDEINSGIGDIVCCRQPDGDPKGSLFCDIGKTNSTYGTCQPATLKQGNSGCKNDTDCDQTKDLKCDIASGKCVANGCSKTVGDDCTSTGDNGCCKSANLSCTDLDPTKNNSPRKCQSNTCSHEGGTCGTAGGSCCLGENLSCNKNKCAGPNSGGACKAENIECTSNAQCCPNLDLMCDLNKLVVDPKGPPKCIKKTAYASLAPSEAKPPSPPCLQNGWTDGQCQGLMTAVGDLQTNPAAFTTRAFAIILSFSGGIALLLIIRAGYMLMTSQGKPEQVQAGRDQLIAAIVGLAFLIFSLVILQVIGYDILRIPEFGVSTGR